MKEEKKNDNNNLTEEERKRVEELEKKLKEMLDEDEIYQKQAKFRALFSYALHPNFLIHNFLMLLVNFLTLSAVMGLTTLGKTPDLVKYLLGVFMFTFFEIYIKLLILKFIPNLVKRSLGLIHLVYLIPLFYFCVVFLGSIEFNQTYQMVIVVLLFFLSRFILNYYIKMFFFVTRRKL